jgi:hypothetical protein
MRIGDLGVGWGKFPHPVKILLSATGIAGYKNSRALLPNCRQWIQEKSKGGIAV